MDKNRFSIYGLFLFLVLVLPQTVWGKRITLFYIGAAPVGKVVNNGHTAAVEAVENQIIKAHLDNGGKLEDLDIEKININDFSNYSPADLLRMEEEYIHKIKTAPQAYTKQYELIKKGSAARDPLLFETHYNLEKLAKFLEGKDEMGVQKKEKAEVVIGAHWLIPLALAQLKYNGRIPEAKTGWIFTDYYENPLFPKISQSIDMTFLGSSTLHEKFEGKGVPKDQLWTSGIPVSPKAMEIIDVDAYKNLKGLSTDPDTITITLAGGGEGLGNYPAIVSNIRKKFKGKKVQVVAICAKNEEHFKNLTALKAKWAAEGDKDFNLKIEGFVPNEEMLNYVKSSDLYIIKSGGLSPTEGAVIGKPMILLDVLGGHERDNLLSYEKMGIGVSNYDPQVIGDQVFELFDGKSGEEKRKKILEAQKKFRGERDFQGVSTFALNPNPPKKDLEKLVTRSPERVLLLKELGIGSRDELKFLKKGQKEMNRKNWDKAMALFEKSLLINPHDYGPHFMMAHIFNHKMDYPKAIHHLNLSLQFDSTQGIEGQFYHRGMIHRKLGKVAEAIDDLAKAANHQGFLYKENAQKILDETFQSLVEKTKDHLLEKIQTMAKNMATEHQEDGAIYLYRKAISLDPDLHETANHEALGEILMQKGDLDQANQIYLEARNRAVLPRDKAGFIVKIAKIYRDSGDMEEARRNLLAAEKIFPLYPGIKKLIFNLDNNLTEDEKSFMEDGGFGDKLFSGSGLFSGKFTPQGALYYEINKWKEGLETGYGLCRNDSHVALTISMNQTMEKISTVVCEQNPLNGAFFQNYLSLMGGLLGKEVNSSEAKQDTVMSMFVGQICVLEAEIKRCQKNEQIESLKKLITKIRKENLHINCHFETSIEIERLKEMKSDSRQKDWNAVALPTENLITALNPHDMLDLNESGQSLFDKIFNRLVSLKEKYNQWLELDRARRTQEKEKVVKEYFDKIHTKAKFQEIKSDPYKLLSVFKEVEKRAMGLPKGHSERVYFEGLEQRYNSRTQKRAEFIRNLNRLEQKFLGKLNGTPYQDVFSNFLNARWEKMVAENISRKKMTEKRKLENPQQFLLPANKFKGSSEQNLWDFYLKKEGL